MPLDQALIGSLVTGVLALGSQIVAKMRCYTSCRKDANGEYCGPQLVCGFMETPLASMDRAQISDDINETSSNEDMNILGTRRVP